MADSNNSGSVGVLSVDALWLLIEFSMLENTYDAASKDLDKIFEQEPNNNRAHQFQHKLKILRLTKVIEAQATPILLV